MVEIEESLCNACNTLTTTIEEQKGENIYYSCKDCGALKGLESEVRKAKRRVGPTDAEKVRLYSSLVGRLKILENSTSVKNQEIRALKHKVELLERKLAYMLERHHNPKIKFNIIGWRGHSTKKKLRSGELEIKEGEDEC